MMRAAKPARHILPWGASGLISDQYRRAAVYVDRILKGAKPAGRTCPGQSSELGCPA
jgi:hypothetical protein